MITAYAVCRWGAKQNRRGVKMGSLQGGLGKAGAGAIRSARRNGCGSPKSREFVAVAGFFQRDFR